MCPCLSSTHSAVTNTSQVSGMGTSPGKAFGSQHTDPSLDQSETELVISDRSLTQHKKTIILISNKQKKNP